MVTSAVALLLVIATTNSFGMANAQSMFVTLALHVKFPFVALTHPLIPALADCPDGSPASSSPDSDGDGVVDCLDECPNAFDKQVHCPTHHHQATNTPKPLANAC